MSVNARGSVFGTHSRPKVIFCPSQLIDRVDFVSYSRAK